MSDWPWRIYVIIHKDLRTQAKNKAKAIFGGAIQERMFDVLPLSVSGNEPVQAYGSNAQVQVGHRDLWKQAIDLMNDTTKARYYVVDADTRIVRLTNSPTVGLVGNPLLFYDALADAGVQVI